MRHAVEPDHLAAVITLSLRAKSPWRSALLGAAWAWVIPWRCLGWVACW